MITIFSAKCLKLPEKFFFYFRFFIYSTFLCAVMKIKKVSVGGLERKRFAFIIFLSLSKNVQELKNRSTKEIAVMAIYLRVLLKRTSLFVSQKFSSFLSSLASVKNRTSPTIHWCIPRYISIALCIFISPIPTSVWYNKSPWNLFYTCFRQALIYCRHLVVLDIKIIHSFWVFWSHEERSQLFLKKEMVVV
jgi:hypothetical protein